MFGFKKNVQPEPVVTEPVVEEPKEPEFVKSDKTLIGEGITMVGDFTGKDPIVINGTLKGNIVSDSVILVSESGQLLGTGNAQKLKIEGYVEGTMNLKDETRFSSTGRMNGLLETVRMHAEDGSKFDGTLKLNANGPVKPAEPEVVLEEAEAEFNEIVEAADNASSGNDTDAEDEAPAEVAEEAKPRARAIPM